MKRLVLLALMFSTCSVFGQKYYEINLAKSNRDRQTISLDYTGIKLVNKLPGSEYSVSIEVELASEEEDKAGKKSPAGQESFRQPCSLEFLLRELHAAKDEKGVEDAMNTLRKPEASETSGECLKEALDSAIRATTETRTFYFELEKNQKIHITITREGREEPWKITLLTPKEANYLSHFGFTFVPKGNRNSDRYYAKETAAGEYTITRMNENGEPFWKDLSLTANYIFPLQRVIDERIRLGVNAGFGLNGNASFTVMAGGTILFYDFLSLNVNYGLYNRYKLKGEYAPAQVLNENLSVDQLNDYGLRPALTISLGFRLSKEQMQAPAEEKGKK